MLQLFSNVDGSQLSINLRTPWFAISLSWVALDHSFQNASFYSPCRRTENCTSSPTVPLPLPTGLLNVSPWITGDSGYSHWMPFTVPLVQSVREWRPWNVVINGGKEGED